MIRHFGQGEERGNRNLKEKRIANGKCCKQKKESRHLWSINQQRKYVQFLKDNKSQFQVSGRLISKIFVKMSKYIRSRDRLQCKAHHHKIMKKLSTVDQIILNFENIVSKGVALDQSDETSMIFQFTNQNQPGLNFDLVDSLNLKEIQFGLQTSHHKSLLDQLSQ